MMSNFKETELHQIDANDVKVGMLIREVPRWRQVKNVKTNYKDETITITFWDNSEKTYHYLEDLERLVYNGEDENDSI